MLGLYSKIEDVCLLDRRVESCGQEGASGICMIDDCGAAWLETRDGCWHSSFFRFILRNFRKHQGHQGLWRSLAGARDVWWTAWGSQRLRHSHQRGTAGILCLMFDQHDQHILSPRKSADSFFPNSLKGLVLPIKLRGGLGEAARNLAPGWARFCEVPHIG